MSETIKQKPKDFVQLEMNFLGLVVLHLCVFLFVYLENESAERWVAGITQGDHVFTGLGVIFLSLGLMVFSRQKHHKFTLGLAANYREELKEEVMKAYIKSSFQRYLWSAVASLMLIAAMYFFNDPFYAAFYALFLVYVTAVRPDYARMLYVTGIKPKVAPQKESKARKI
jgi:hypothetical protein